MKRLFVFILLGSLLLVGCTKKESAELTTDLKEEKLNVVATIFPQYDFVREIAGDNVELSMLLPPGTESHSFEPTPQDIIKIQNSDLFIYVGGESDVWIDRILDSMDTSKIKIISLMDLVETVEEEYVEGMEQENQDIEDVEDTPEYDEHVWTSPRNAKIIVAALAQELASLDAEHATIYQTSAANYMQRLDELDKQFQNVVDNGVRKTIVFGDRFPFRYFADAYGLEYFAAFPGCSTETEPSAGTIAFLIDKVKEENIPVVFHIELSNEKIADTICESTDATKGLLHTCHNLTRKEFDRGITYLELMEGNVAALKEALQ